MYYVSVCDRIYIELYSFCVISFTTYQEYHRENYIFHMLNVDFHVPMQQIWGPVMHFATDCDVTIGCEMHYRTAVTILT